MNYEPNELTQPSFAQTHGCYRHKNNTYRVPLSAAKSKGVRRRGRVEGSTEEKGVKAKVEAMPEVEEEVDDDLKQKENVFKADKPLIQEIL